MKYFLMIGLMVMSSFAQANVCIPLWWEPATDVQVEIEADFNPLAMNELCEDGRWPVEIALENITYLPVFAAIIDNFELDERARYQLRVVAGRQLQQAYEELASRAEAVSELTTPEAEFSELKMSAREFIEAVRDMSPEKQIAVFHLIGLWDEYPEKVERVNNEINGNNIIEINKEIDGVDFYTSSGRNYYTDGPSRRDIRRAREAYDRALEEYRTRLVIYDIVVPSE